MGVLAVLESVGWVGDVLESRDEISRCADLSQLLLCAVHRCSTTGCVGVDARHDFNPYPSAGHADIMIPSGAVADPEDIHMAISNGHDSD
ncbi:hypothetical protein FRC12_010200 [Ceratobasidium sp. 428]|nr:hypothetical protein FRC12_010200 [Ceratobasidium sp. 428]